MYVMDHKQIAIPMLNIIVIQILNTHVIQTHNTTVITTLLVTILAKAIVALTQIQGYRTKSVAINADGTS